MRLPLLRTLSVACVLVAASDCLAQDGISDEKLAGFVRAMNADDWKVREQARDELTRIMLSPLADLETRLSMAFDRNRQVEIAEEIAAITLPNLHKLEASLQDPDLTPEQIESISNVAYKLFARGPRGAMGVSFGGSRTRGEGVMIGSPVPGFDSMRVFQAGDSLRKIGGLSINSDLEARIAIVSYDPGATVEVEFVRAGEVRTDRLVLGDFSKLQNSRALDASTMRRAWRLRVDRLRNQTTVTIATPASTSRYNNAVQLERLEAGRARLEQQSATLQVSITPLNIDAGGSSREMVTRPEEEFSLSTDDATNPHRDAIANLTNQINQYDRQMKQIENQLREANLNPAERARLKNNLGNFALAIESMRQERRALRAAGVEEVGNETTAVDEDPKQQPDR